MNADNEARVELDIILKKKPVFFIQWGSTAFVLIVVLLFLLAYSAGYDLLSLFGKK
jgi:hypothetical protein